MKKLCYTLALLLVLLLSVSACRTAGTTIQRHAVEHQIDTISLVKYQTDSVYIKDSIYIRQAGDTIYADRWHTAYKYKYIYRDSMHVRVDSIPYPVEVEKRVAYTPAFTKCLAWIGGIAILLLLALAGIKIYRLFP